MQHLEALKRANEVRFAGAAVRREIAAGSLSLEDALTDPRAARLPIARLLDAQVRWGQSRTWTLLKRLHISEAKRVEELTANQVDVIAAAAVSHHHRRR